MVKGNQLQDVITMASLAILLSSAGVTQMHKMLYLKVRVMATKTMASKVMVVVMVMVIRA